MTVKTNRILFVLCLMLLPLMLTGCSCEHEWRASTCLAPRTCIHCGETQGKVRAHDWGSTACNAPEPCTVCGTMEGMELTHEWQEDCKICIHCGHDERPADDRFMDNLSAGINKRWSLYWYEDSSLTKEDWTNCIKAEYDLLIPFLDEKFQDKDLGEAAQTYVRCVAASMEEVKSFDPETWNDVYDSKIFQEQCMALYHIDQIRPVSVAEEHSPRLEYTLNQGEIIDMIFPFFDEILFLYIDGSNTMKKYETTLENTTTLTFKKFIFEIDLYDENGNVLDMVESAVERWKPGFKQRFNFKTDVEFHSLKVRFARWEF